MCKYEANSKSFIYSLNVFSFLCVKCCSEFCEEFKSESDVNISLQNMYNIQYQSKLAEPQNKVRGLFWNLITMILMFVWKNKWEIAIKFFEKNKSGDIY